MTETAADKREWVCDGCSSWTAEDITREQLLSDEWGWIEGDDDLGEQGYVPVYCPECM